MLFILVFLDTLIKRCLIELLRVIGPLHLLYQILVRLARRPISELWKYNHYPNNRRIQKCVYCWLLLCAYFQHFTIVTPHNSHTYNRTVIDDFGEAVIEKRKWLGELLWMGFGAIKTSFFVNFKQKFDSYCGIVKSIIASLHKTAFIKAQFIKYYRTLVFP